MSATKLIGDINNAFDAVFGAGHGISPSLAGKTAAKLYELKVLGRLLVALRKFGYQLKLKPGANGFKGSPGWVNASYTYVEIHDQEERHVANVWTDTEFIGLSSYQLAGNSSPSGSGEYHELDILVCDSSVSTGQRPSSDQVYIGVECKHWASGVPKKLLREVLGVRRELSFLNGLSSPQPVSIGLGVHNSSPASELIFATSTDGKKVKAEWAVPAKEFEIEIWDIPV